MKIHKRQAALGMLLIAVLLLIAGAAFAQFDAPETYPSFKGDPDNFPVWVTLENDYIACRIGVQGNILAKAVCNDADDGGDKYFRGDKVFHTEDHKWGVSGRYGIVAKKGDPETLDDDDMPLTFMGMAPCHYFGYWKLRIGDDTRMVGDGASGRWYNPVPGQPIFTPTRYQIPPAELADKEPGLGYTGPLVRGIWSTSGGNGSTIITDIRIHLVRDLVRFEYRITNTGNVAENIGFQQYGDVETGAPAFRTSDDGGYYGPYQNKSFAYVQGAGATQPAANQQAMIYGGRDFADSKTPNPVVPDWFEVYDDVYNPGVVTRNVLGLEDATKPDMAAIGEHNDLFHKDLWLPLHYRPDKLHSILDMAWLLCWDQKYLLPGATRTIITYYGIGAATSHWTYKSGRNAVRDSAVLSVQAPRSLKYDSTNLLSNMPEYSPSMFSVKAYVYNLATDPGPYELRETTATISLPKGLELVPGIPGNDASQLLEEIVERDSESIPVEWVVRATGDYSGELPIYVSVADSDPYGRYWQQTVTRPIYVPAAKRGHFDFGWQLMHVPFTFNNPYFTASGNPFGLVPGTFGAQYQDPVRNRLMPLTKLTPGQAFWMYVGGLSWNQIQTFRLPADAAIAGESGGSGKQTREQRIALSRGWNMIGNPFVYPVHWGQVLVHRLNETVTLDAASTKNWMDKTLFSWNTAKWDYDITSDKGTLLNPWTGYWVYAKQPVTLVFRPPVLPGGDVTANPGGK